MKKMIITLAFLLVAGLSNSIAQQQSTSTENKKIVTHVAGNYYDVIFVTEDGAILQKGHYLSIDDRLTPHGVWKLYDRNTFDLVTTAKYDKGEQLWVETIVDGEIVRVNKMDLKVKKLQDKIAALEKKIEELEN